MDIVNHSAGLITSYHMFDAVVRGMITPSNEVVFTNANTNTISGVLCISDTLLWCLVVNSSGKTVSIQLYPKMMRNFNKILCYYIWTLYYIRTGGIIWTFCIQIYSDYHLNYIYIYYCCIWLVVFCYGIKYAICVYCKFMWITCISTCALGILKTCFHSCTPDW